MAGKVKRTSPSTGRSRTLPQLVSFPTPAALKRALKETAPATEFDEVEFDKLVALRVPPLISPTAMGLLLGISPKLITAMAKFPDTYYRKFNMKKRSGKKRVISAPRTYLKAVQKYILRHVLEKQVVAENITGFVRGRGTVDNARLHLSASYILNVDIKDFFTSVRSSLVVQLFGQLGFAERMAEVLALLCTYEGVLPQGAPTSPLI